VWSARLIAEDSLRRCRLSAPLPEQKPEIEVRGIYIGPRALSAIRQDPWWGLFKQWRRGEVGSTSGRMVLDEVGGEIAVFDRRVD